MSVIKLTFDGANNTAKMDAYLGAYLTNYQNGIIRGLGDHAEYVIANGRITFKSGFVCVYGRRLYIEDGTFVTVDLDANKYGFVVLNIDTNHNTAEIGLVERSGSLPSLTQTNLLKEDGLYQYVLCAYIKTTSSLTENENYKRSYVYPLEEQLTYAKNELLYKFKRKYIYNCSSGNSVFKFDLSKIDTTDGLAVIPINSNVMVTIPCVLFGSTLSVGSTEYRYMGSDYNLLHEVTPDNQLILTTGNAEHKIHFIYIYY